MKLNLLFSDHIPLRPFPIPCSIPLQTNPVKLIPTATLDALTIAGPCMFNRRPTLRAPLNQRHIVPPTFFQRVSKSDLISIITTRVTATFRSTLEPFSNKKKNITKASSNPYKSSDLGFSAKSKTCKQFFSYRASALCNYCSVNTRTSFFQILFCFHLQGIRNIFARIY